MLYLNRRAGEVIAIETPQGLVRLHVIKMRRYEGVQQIVLGFDAPKEVRIDRAEVHEQRRQEAQRDL